VILCDTGPLVAAFNAAARDHERCVDFRTCHLASTRSAGQRSCVVTPRPIGQLTPVPRSGQ
jgi:hypothetical protein